MTSGAIRGRIHRIFLGEVPPELRLIALGHELHVGHPLARANVILGMTMTRQTPPHRERMHLLHPGHEEKGNPENAGDRDPDGESKDRIAPRGKERLHAAISNWPPTGPTGSQWAAIEKSYDPKRGWQWTSS